MLGMSCVRIVLVGEKWRRLPNIFPQETWHSAHQFLIHYSWHSTPRVEAQGSFACYESKILTLASEHGTHGPQHFNCESVIIAEVVMLK